MFCELLPVSDVFILPFPSLLALISCSVLKEIDIKSFDVAGAPFYIAIRDAKKNVFLLRLFFNVFFKFTYSLKKICIDIHVKCFIIY